MTLPTSYFDDLYGSSPDPWGFTSRWYEQRKYALTVAALPAPHYDRALEIGCSIGVLTTLLAARCSHLLATDISAEALARARERVPDNVTLQQMSVPEQWPASSSWDLVVLSEVAYYLSVPDLTALLERVEHSTAPGATLLACHWRHPVPDYPQTGDQVHAALDARPGWTRMSRVLEEDFVLDVLTKGEAVSVARREGVA